MASDEARARAKKKAMVKTYGITPEQRDAMIARQGGECAGCRRRFGTEHRPAIDHCHGTGAVRGVLCHRCNSILAFSGDSPEVLRRLARYLDPYEGIPEPEPKRPPAGF
jgi:hypothetical protein